MDREWLRTVALSEPEAFATALADAVIETTRHTPAPKSLPFFGLDHPDGCGSRLLDRLSDLGIFRFYERVLDLGTSVGGPARWLARRRGCRVVSACTSPASARASRLLNRRAHLEAQVSVATADLAHLPFADDSFTHAWSVEWLHRVERKAEIVRELYRVVRPGGHVAIQDWMARDESPRSLATIDVYREALEAAGFTDVRDSIVDALREPASTMAQLLEQGVYDILSERPGSEPGSETTDAELSNRGALVQIFATRPA